MKKPGSHIYVDENGGWPEVALVPLPLWYEEIKCIAAYKLGRAEKLKMKAQLIYYIYVTVEHWCHNKYDYYLVIYIVRV